MKSDFTENSVFHDYERQFGYNFSAGCVYFFAHFSQNMGRYCKCLIFTIFIDLYYVHHLSINNSSYFVEFEVSNHNYAVCQYTLGMVMRNIILVNSSGINKLFHICNVSAFNSNIYM